MNTLEDFLKVPFYKIGGYTIDVGRRLIIFNEYIKKMTNKELHILIVLIHNQNISLDKLYLLELIWGEDNYFNSRSLDVYVCKIRKLLEHDDKIHISKKDNNYKLLIN